MKYCLKLTITDMDMSNFEVKCDKFDIESVFK